MAQRKLGHLIRFVWRLNGVDHLANRPNAASRFGNLDHARLSEHVHGALRANQVLKLGGDRIGG